MTDSHPAGEHMTLEVFQQALEFTQRVEGNVVVMISGGEPTRHPDLVGMLRLTRRYGFHVILLSNGLFFGEQPHLAAKIEPLVDAIQVTNDPRFYPRTVAVPAGQHVDTVISSVAPFGRAKTGSKQITRRTPFCLNLRSVMRRLNHVQEALSFLRTRGISYCTPSINTDGTVVAGEAPECAQIGTVLSSADELSKAVLDLRCNACGLMDNLTSKSRMALGVQ